MRTFAACGLPLLVIVLIGPSACSSDESSPVAVKKCVGVALRCGGLNEAECSSQRGCDWKGRCTGTRRDCETYSTSTACRAQSICFWSSSSETCRLGTGKSSTCASVTFESSCTKADGCSWEGACEGSSQSCASLAVTTCSSQRGCSVEDGSTSSGSSGTTSGSSSGGTSGASGSSGTSPALAECKSKCKSFYDCHYSLCLRNKGTTCSTDHSRGLASCDDLSTSQCTSSLLESYETCD